MAVNMRSEGNSRRVYIFPVKQWNNIFYAHMATRAKIHKYRTSRNALEMVNYFNEDMIRIRII